MWLVMKAYDLWSWLDIIVIIIYINDIDQMIMYADSCYNTTFKVRINALGDMKRYGWMSRSCSWFIWVTMLPTETPSNDMDWFYSQHR